jgi:hypothetical protein
MGILSPVPLHTANSKYQISRVVPQNSNEHAGKHTAERVIKD